MALAAESGTDAVVCSAAAGSRARPTRSRASRRWPRCRCSAHVGRAAARSGVPLRVLVNDPLAGVAAERGPRHRPPPHGDARATRRGRASSSPGEGRPALSGLAMTARARPAAALALGSLREEATLLLEGLRSGGGSLSAGTAEAAQAADRAPGRRRRPASGRSCSRPPPTCAPTERADDGDGRQSAPAGWRVAVLVVGSVLSLAGVIEPSDLLLGIGGPVRRPTIPALVIAVGVLAARRLPRRQRLARRPSRGWPSMRRSSSPPAPRSPRVGALALRRGSDLWRRRGDPIGAALVLAGMAAVLVAGLRPGADGRVGSGGRLARRRAAAPDRRDAVRAALRDDPAGRTSLGRHAGAARRSSSSARRSSC